MKKTLITGILVGLLINSHILAFAPTMMGVIGQSSEFLPIDYSPVLWLDASQITGLSDTDPVATWSDESGNANDATQSNSTYRPTYQTNEINSKPIIRFDGSDDFLNGSYSVASNSSTIIFMVVKPSSIRSQMLYDEFTGADYWRFSISMDSSGHIEYSYRDTSSGDTGSRTVITGSTVLSAGTSYLVTIAHYAGTGTYIYINGSLDNSGSSPAAFTSTTGIVRIGNDFGSSPASLNGDICEIITYDKTLTQTERENIDTYLNNKYSIY